MASEQQMQFIWSLTSAKHDFYGLYAAALTAPQIVTRRGVPAYVFRPATARERKHAGASEAVIVQALVCGTERN
jgi:hypothetical protein